METYASCLWCFTLSLVHDPLLHGLFLGRWGFLLTFSHCCAIDSFERWWKTMKVRLDKKLRMCTELDLAFKILKYLFKTHRFRHDHFHFRDRHHTKGRAINMDETTDDKLMGSVLDSVAKICSSE